MALAKKIPAHWPHYVAVSFALAAGSFVFWQNARVAVLWDLGYLLDTSWRIACGQMPYRDFPLAHPPLTFLIQAALINLFGRHYIIVKLYAATTGALSVWLSWLILSRLIPDRRLALALTAPLVFLSTQAVYPHPIYDTDCALLILLTLWLLLTLSQSAAPTLLRGSLTGVAVITPIFAKQNIGLAFAFTVGLAALALLFMPAERRKALGLLAGMLATSLLTLGALAATCGLGNYYHWTVAFAAARRMPGLASILAIYQTPFVYWALPVVLIGWLLIVNARNGWMPHILTGTSISPYVHVHKSDGASAPEVKRRWSTLLGLALMAAPFLWTLWVIVSSEDADDKADAFLALWPLLLLVASIAALAQLRRGITLWRLMPFLILAAIHGAFLSQQLWGSTYAIWPLLILLIAPTLATLPSAPRRLAFALTLIISVVFLVSGFVYSSSLERLSYVDLPVHTPPVHATIPALRGLATPGDYLANFAELIHWTEQNIPQGDAILILPGEDPFYYATGRTPRFPVTMMDPATDPYSASGLMEAARQSGVRWVIVKRALQVRENPMPAAEETMQQVGREFRMVKQMRGYDLWERIKQY